MGVTVHGAEAIERRLEALNAELQREILEEAALAGAHVIAEEARALAPVLPKATTQREPGALRRAIMTLLRARRSPGHAGVDIGPNKNSGIDAFYARFVEYGTRKMAAEPFLRPALLTKGDAATEVVRQRITAAVERVGR